MAEEQGEHSVRVPENIVGIIYRVVRTSRQMLPEIGREPTPEELAEKLGMPLDKLHKVLEIARSPIRLDTRVADSHTG
jgi:RNA polymerase primary sigma factor